MNLPWALLGRASLALAALASGAAMIEASRKQGEESRAYFGSGLLGLSFTGALWRLPMDPLTGGLLFLAGLGVAVMISGPAGDSAKNSKPAN